MTTEEMNNLTKLLKGTKVVCKLCQHKIDPTEILMYFDKDVVYLCKMCHNKIVGSV